jgi:hypothetical protein
MANSFSALYEAWVDSKLRDEDLEAELVRIRTRSWQVGDAHDRMAVLSFILRRRDKDGVDLVVEGLQSNEPALAQHASAVASVLIKHRVIAGSEIRNALRRFGDRYPEWDVVSRAALDSLDRAEQPE